LRDLGVDVVLAMPADWPGAAEAPATDFPIVELPVTRAGDVNRHRYVSQADLAATVHTVESDLLDVHEEPFSVATRQWLAAAPSALPVVLYTAQNVDKRYPPPFSTYERRAYQRARGLYPCSWQAASVARGKGFRGLIDVIPLGYDPDLFRPGEQSADDDELVLALFGRFVPEKGILDAVRVLERLNSVRPARLVLVGSGPEEQRARDLAAARGLADRISIESWQSSEAVAELYRQAHVVLVPSTSTETWTEQFGRVIVEAHASGALVAGYGSGAIPEVALDAGVLVRPGEAIELADSIIEVMADSASYAAHRDRGFSLAATRTWARVAEAHANLYRRVLEQPPRRAAPRSPRERRRAAVAEFGPTAELRGGGARPFALPILRRGGSFARALGWLLDAVAELLARVVLSRTRQAQ
jgi:glycosyltransferase involved in cell wall biosynthesis